MKQGRTMHFCEAHVYCINEHGDEELIAHATTTMTAIIKPKHRGVNMQNHKILLQH
jgi:acyl-coenzyme A thioesterase PaaI-like protein